MTASLNILPNGRTPDEISSVVPVAAADGTVQLAVADTRMQAEIIQNSVSVETIIGKVNALPSFTEGPAAKKNVLHAQKHLMHAKNLISIVRMASIGGIDPSTVLSLLTQIQNDLLFNLTARIKGIGNLVGSYAPTSEEQVDFNLEIVEINVALQSLLSPWSGQTPESSSNIAQRETEGPYQAHEFSEQIGHLVSFEKSVTAESILWSTKNFVSVVEDQCAKGAIGSDKRNEVVARLEIDFFRKMADYLADVGYNIAMDDGSATQDEVDAVDYINEQMRVFGKKFAS